METTLYLTFICLIILITLYLIRKERRLPSAAFGLLILICLLLYLIFIKPQNSINEDARTEYTKPIVIKSNELEELNLNCNATSDIKENESLGKEYSVKKGESLWEIAIRFYGHSYYLYSIVFFTNEKAITNRSYRPIYNASQIQPKQKVYLPTRDEAYQHSGEKKWNITFKYSPDSSDISIGSNSILSQATENISNCFISAFNNNQYTESKYLEVRISNEDIEQSIKNFLSGNFDLLITDDKISFLKYGQSIFNKKVKMRPCELKVAEDEIALVVSKINPYKLSDLSMYQLHQLLIYGNKWSDVDNNYASNKINRFYPSKNSGNYKLVMGELLDSNDINSLKISNIIMEIEDDNKIAQKIKDDPFGIGIISEASFNRFGDGLELIPVEGQLPLSFVQEGTYSSYLFKKELYLYVSPIALTENPLVKEYITYYLHKVRYFISDLGYIPLSEHQSNHYVQVFENYCTQVLRKLD